MKQLQNDFTTPEQSKRLLELGVPADSAGCYYGKDGKLHYIDGTIPYSLLWETGCTPCWSVGRLIEIILKVPGFPYVGPEKCINLTNRNISKIIDLIIETIEVNLDDIDFSKLEE